MTRTTHMSKENTTCLRGIFAVMVVIHHLYQYSGILRGGVWEIILRAFGYLSVAVFFFFSGYGLMLSCRREGYVDGFLKKKFLPLYLFHIVLIALFALWTVVLEGFFPTEKFISSFFFGKTVVTNGWYLQTTFLTYLIFWAVFKVIKADSWRMIAFSIGIGLYCLLCEKMKLGRTWYQSIPCMVLGMVYCHKQDAIDRRWTKHSIVSLVVTALLFLGTFMQTRIGVHLTLWRCISALFFVCFVVALTHALENTKVINNKFNKLLGVYSLEIYVSHGLFLRLIKLGYIENLILYNLTVFAGTIVLAIALKKIYNLLLSVFNGG